MDIEHEPHLSFFSVESVRKLMEKNGFRLVYLGSSGALLRKSFILGAWLNLERALLKLKIHLPNGFDNPHGSSILAIGLRE